MPSSFRNATPAQLAAMLQDARDYTLALFERFQAAGLDDPARVPYLAIVNPPLWELGHTAWFAEWFVLREAATSDPGSARRPCLLDAGDRWFDSNTVAHASRWTLDLPDTTTIKGYAEEVLQRILEKLADAPDDAEALYPFRLVLAHQDMHGEAFAYTLQTLGLTAPPMLAGTSLPGTRGSSAAPRDLHFSDTTFQLGSPVTHEFVFDNEKWAHPVQLAAFDISPTPVSNSEYRRFMLEGGYDDPRFWSAAGQAWLASTKRSAPRYWQRDGKLCERFGITVALPDDEPVRHVNLHEAQAYCRWAGRRLPSEAEWELAALSGRAAMSGRTDLSGQAALSGQPDFRWGDLWEWTSSAFEPYPGFTADRYLEYSAPWFGTHQVLRGASFVTRPRMRSAHYRNFFMPERDDIFAGFRTCAVH
jgi:iron(II)-dependent oxidoreductase